MKKMTLLAIALASGSASMASAEGMVLIHTLNSTSGDCIVAENGSVTIENGACETYIESRLPGTLGSSSTEGETSAPAGLASRTLVTSTLSN